MVFNIEEELLNCVKRNCVDNIGTRRR